MKRLFISVIFEVVLVLVVVIEIIIISIRLFLKIRNPVVLLIPVVLMTRFLLVIVEDLGGINILLRVSLLLDSGQGRLRSFKFFPSIVEV